MSVAYCLDALGAVEAAKAAHEKARSREFGSFEHSGFRVTVNQHRSIQNAIVIEIWMGRQLTVDQSEEVENYLAEAGYETSVCLNWDGWGTLYTIWLSKSHQCQEEGWK